MHVWGGTGALMGGTGTLRPPGSSTSAAPDCPLAPGRHRGRRRRRICLHPSARHRRLASLGRPRLRREQGLLRGPSKGGAFSWGCISLTKNYGGMISNQISMDVCTDDRTGGIKSLGGKNAYEAPPRNGGSPPIGRGGGSQIERTFKVLNKKTCS